VAPLEPQVEAYRRAYAVYRGLYPALRSTFAAM
jgi:hypothetical protein